VALTLDDIESLFRDKGDAQYSREPVSQLEHALQSAHLAEEEGADEAREFIGRPHAEDAVRLRLWDDKAKKRTHTTPDLAHYLVRARRCMTAPTA